MSRANQRSGPGQGDDTIRNISTVKDLNAANYTVLQTDEYVRLTDSGGGGFAAVLPAAPDNGKGFFFKHAGITNTVSITRGGGDTIEGAATIKLAIGDSTEVVYVAGDTNWEVWG